MTTHKGRVVGQDASRSRTLVVTFQTDKQVQKMTTWQWGRVVGLAASPNTILWLLLRKYKIELEGIVVVWTWLPLPKGFLCLYFEYK